MIVIVGINLVIGYVLVYKTGLDNCFCGIHIVCGDINAFFIRRENGFNAAPDINTPANIVRTLNINLAGIAVVIFNSEKGGVSQRQNQQKYHEEYRLACSFGLHWQILHYM